MSANVNKEGNILGSALRHAGVLTIGRWMTAVYTSGLLCSVQGTRWAKSQRLDSRVTAMREMEVDLRVKFTPLAHLHSPGS